MPGPTRRTGSTRACSSSTPGMRCSSATCCAGPRPPSLPASCRPSPSSTCRASRPIPKRHGVRSETVIACNFAKRVVLIGGSSYAGETKKSVFTFLNYACPSSRVMPMHCSANVGPGGDAAVFFGLSGTGKTTLSADPKRTLLGDDEHGWSDDGIYNFEGGCYAKTIRLSKEAEPEIWAATNRFGAVLENVILDPDHARARLRRRPPHREHPLRLSARVHLQRQQDRHRRPPQEHRDADGRRLRRAAAHRQAVAEPGDVPFPVGLHGQGGRHREGRGHRAAGDVLDLLRRALHAAPSRASTATCCAS